MKEISDTIVNKAIKLIDDKKISIINFNKCIEAGICPTCGEALEIETVNKTYITVNIFGWLKKTLKYKQYNAVCPNKHLLIDPNTEFNVSNIESSIYSRCINKKIKSLHDTLNMPYDEY